jgi:hypothetical protein
MKSLLFLLAPATTFAAALQPRVTAPAVATTLAPASSLPSGWQYAQCRIDGLNPRSLSLAATTDPAMTGAKCISFCGSKGYNVAGTEYSNQCYCGTVLPSLAQESDCNMPCSGSSSEACGGPARLTVYQNTAQGAPVVSSGANGWISYGCVADSVQDRTLPNWAKTAGLMTVEGCISACQAGGYSYGGVEVRNSIWLLTHLTSISMPRNVGAATLPH